MGFTHFVSPRNTLDTLESLFLAGDLSTVNPDSWGVRSFMGV